MGGILWGVSLQVTYCGMFYQWWHIEGCLPMGGILYGVFPHVTHCGVFGHVRHILGWVTQYKIHLLFIFIIEDERYIVRIY